MAHTKLGELLIKRGLITGPQLAQTLQNQVVYGVRLGTALVQDGYIKLDELGRSLSIQHGVPHADTAACDATDPQSLAIVSRELCSMHKIWPIRVDGNMLHLAMRDPLRSIAGVVSYELGFTIKRYVVPELRLAYYLEKFYGIVRDARFLREKPVQHDDERRRYIEPSVQGDEALKESYNAELDELAVKYGLIYLDHRDSQPLAQASIQRPVDSVVSRLHAADSGQAIAKLLVEPIIEVTQAQVLFWVRNQVAVACWAHGVTMSLQELQKLAVPLNTPSMFQWAAESIKIVRAEAATDNLQANVANYLGYQPPKEVCVAPVTLNQRVVNLICVHSPPDRGFVPDILTDLGALTTAAEAAYLRLATAQK